MKQGQIVTIPSSSILTSFPPSFAGLSFSNTTGLTLGVWARFEFNEVLYVPGKHSSFLSFRDCSHTFESFMSGLFFSVSESDLCAVALSARALWVSQEVSTWLCSQSEQGLSWTDCKSQGSHHGFNQCLVLTLLHV